jgi:molybdenum cofactor cytidylyltransferase
MIPRPRVLLLAAGGSRRFGGPKLLARRGGESLLRRAARVALGCRSAGCTVVLGASAIRLERELRGLAVDIVVNRAWRTGLSSSLRAGIAVLPAAVPGALVLLADQVSVGPADLELLIAAWQRDPRAIVAARAGEVLGPPVILPRSAFRAVRRLRGDAGAKALLSDPHRTVVEIGITAAGFDVDTPADLARWRAGSVLS